MKMNIWKIALFGLVLAAAHMTLPSVARANCAAYFDQDKNGDQWVSIVCDGGYGYSEPVH
jgi:hypothetical protein